MQNDFLQSERFRELKQRHRALMKELAGLGWLTDGSVIPNHPGSWRWTRKVNAKTVAVSLSTAQAELFKSAIANHRRLEETLREPVSYTHLFQSGGESGTLSLGLSDLIHW